MSAWLIGSVAPAEASPVDRQNFIYVQGEGIGIGLLGGADSFLPIFLVRLGASNFQIGLLIAMPALIGLLVAVAVSRFLQRQHNVGPLYSKARIVQAVAYTLTGLVTIALPVKYSVVVVLGVWAAAAFPQAISAITFPMVMNAVAGPNGRYELLSRRWSVMGFTTAVTVFLAGQLLARLSYPYNYQTVFIILSSGGLISLYFSRQLVIHDMELRLPPQSLTLLVRLRIALAEIRSKNAFALFIGRRFVFLAGVAIAATIIPLYFLREAHFDEAAIGFVSTAHTLGLVTGYRSWARITRFKGVRLVLLSTTLGLALYPALVASTGNVGALVLLGGMSGWFQSGLDLVFFDELMKSVPPRNPEIFLTFSQSLVYVSSICAPLAGILLAGYIGLGGTLFVSAGLCAMAFLMFLGDRN